MSYDYTVLAGTQGIRNHGKKDRLFEFGAATPASGRPVRRGWRWPRPGGFDMPIISALACRASQYFE
jgi:hypothetical protein